MWHLRGHGERISELTFSPDGRYLASADRAGRVLLWDQTAPGDPIPAFAESDEPGHYVGGLCFKPGGRELLIARTIREGVDCGSGQILVWDWEDPSITSTWVSDPGYGIVIDSSPVGDILWGLLTASEGPPYRIWFRGWRITNGEEVPERSVKYAIEPEQYRVITTDSRAAVLSGNDDVVRLFSTIGDRRHEIDWSPHSVAPRGLAFLSQHDWGEGYVLTAKATYMALWGARLQEVRRIARIGGPHITSVAISADQTRLAVGRTDGTVNLLDTASWSEVTSYRWPLRHVDQLVFAPDGFRVAAGGRNGRIVVWDIE